MSGGVFDAAAESRVRGHFFFPFPARVFVVG